MRKFFASILLCAILLFCTITTPAQAEAPPPAENPTNGALSPEDAQKMREQLILLQKVLDIQPEQGTSNTNNTIGSQKSMADVADKALNMVNQLVGSMSVTLQKVAPDIWRIMIRQQYAKAIMGPFIPFGIIILALVYGNFMKKSWKLNDSPTTDEEGFHCALVSVIPTLVWVIAGIVFVFKLGGSIAILINPEYYAIRDLVLLLLGKV